jgi:hypothetical protein
MGVDVNIKELLLRLRTGFIMYESESEYSISPKIGSAFEAQNAAFYRKICEKSLS